MKSFNRAIDAISINEKMMAPDQAVQYANDKGFSTKGGTLKTIKGYDKPELVSGGGLRSELIDVIDHIHNETGLKMVVTGGHDKWHTTNSPTSKHNKGNALDFVVRPDSRKNIDKIEKVIVDMMISSKFDTSDAYRLGGINEYDKPTGHATAGHFHISFTPDASKFDGKECIFPRHNINSYKDIRILRVSGKDPKFNATVNQNRPQTSDDISTVTQGDAVKLYAMGSSGDNVEKIQQTLISKGYVLPKYGADGKFGSETRSAVIRFQTDSKIAMDGIVGPITWKSLFGTDAPGTKQLNTNIKPPTDSRALEIYNGSKFLYTSSENGITYEVSYNQTTEMFIALPKSKFRRNDKNRGDIYKKDNMIFWKNNDGKESQIVNKHDYNFFAVMFNKINMVVKGQGTSDMNNIAGKPQEFINKFGPLMISATKNTPLLPSVKMAQAALETGWGKSTIGNGNNLFGIKATGSPSEYWKGDSVTASTVEYIGGNRGTYDKAFRKYSSYENSILDHSRLLLTSKNYDGVRQATTAEGQTLALKAGGYATAPNYAQTLMSIINKYNLKELDTQAGKNIA